MDDIIESDILDDILESKRIKRADERKPLPTDSSIVHYLHSGRATMDKSKHGIVKIVLG